MLKPGFWEKPLKSAQSGFRNFRPGTSNIELVGAQEGDRDRGGQNVQGTRPESCPGNAWTLTPKLRIFYRISVEKAQIQGPPKIENVHPPSNFRRFDPHLSRSPSTDRRGILNRDHFGWGSQICTSDQRNPRTVPCLAEAILAPVL